MSPVEKRHGGDWEVTYLEVATGERDTMSVFGAPTIDSAISEARFSLNALIRDDWYEIIEVKRT